MRSSSDCFCNSIIFSHHIYDILLFLVYNMLFYPTTKCTPVSSYLFDILSNFFHRWVFVIGQGQGGIKKRKNLKATIYRELKQYPRLCPVTFGTFVKTWFKAEIVKVNIKLHMEVNFLSEKQKKKNNCTTFASKRGFFHDLLSFGGEQCHRLWFIAVVFANWANIPLHFGKILTKIFFFLSFLNLFQEVHQILHFTRPDEI